MPLFDDDGDDDDIGCEHCECYNDGADCCECGEQGDGPPPGIDDEDGGSTQHPLFSPPICDDDGADEDKD